ncbi:MAG TPA: hypothetical protein VFI23_12890 [Rhizomicrobium sp.]|nr:hypothetical protein [Rhizomicrobium sp.]
MRYFWWLAVFLVLALPAQARPRDDALSGAFRCAGIADSRQWLDCYYGAAQPVRAALNLPGALPAQVRLAAAPPVGGVPRDETVRDEVMSGAAGCIRVAADRSWLDCYYAAAMPMRVQLGLATPQNMPQNASRPAPQIASAAPVPPPRPVAPAGPPPMPRNTGLLNGMFNNIKPVVRHVPMQSFTLDKDGAVTVTLSDGEVWKQPAEDAVYHPVRWRKPASEMLVTIAPDAMHTFTMTVDGESRFYKVRRIK